MRNLLIFSVLVMAMTSCGLTVYRSSILQSAVTNHKTVAILPATVIFRPAKKMTTDQLNELAKQAGYDIQENMHLWLLKRSDDRQFTVSFQDVIKTNSLLKESGIEYAGLPVTDAEKIAKILGVDAVITTRINMDKLKSDGAAVAAALLAGFNRSANNVVTNMTIRDGNSGEAIWKYDLDASGSAVSSPAQLVEALMRSASKEFPYTGKK